MRTGRQKGFTLIELLVVIAIIAILSSITIVLLSNMKAKGRDAARMASLHQIENALNLYFNNHNRFPIEQSLVVITGTDSFSLALKDDLVIPEVRPDPIYPSSYYTYISNTSGTDYTITFCLETDTVSLYAKGCSNTISP